MKTASERRAAGEAEFCDCATCIYGSRTDLHWLSRTAIYMSGHECERIAALLRAIVVQRLLTWSYS